MARRVLQNHLHFSNFIERVDGLCILVCDDRDSEMRDPISVDIIGAFQRVGLFDEGAILC